MERVTTAGSQKTFTYASSTDIFYTKPVKTRETGRNIIISEDKSPSYFRYTMATAIAFATKDMMTDPIVFPGKQKEELIDVPFGLEDETEEFSGWLKTSLSSFDIWDEDEDLFDDNL